MDESMSRRGNCYDNAPMESFWGLLKNELGHHRHFKTKAITEYIGHFTDDSASRLGWAICLSLHLSASSMKKDWWHESAGVSY